MIDIKNLSYKIKDKEIVKDATLSCKEGQITALLGANGAGKSTLLKLLSAELAQQSGQISINGKELAKYSTLELAQKRSVMPQNVDLNFDFTALEVVLMGRSAHNAGIDSEADKKIALNCLAEVECEHLKDRSFTTLSGGEKQRITLARVLAQIAEVDKPILLMDEPIANLDPEHQQAAMKSAKRRAAEGATVFLILHDFNIAANYADKIYIINHGEITYSGSAEEVFQKQIIKENFNVDIELITHPKTGKPQLIFL